MREGSKPKPTQISLTDLTPEHQSAVERALVNIFSTNLAFDTFAQIVDGLPTRDDYREYYGSWRDDFHNNLEPSQEARQVVVAFQTDFSIRTLQIDAKVAQLYQRTEQGSRDFFLRLIEVIAIACHDIAVKLFINFDGGLRKPDLAVPCYTELELPPLPNGVKVDLPPPPPPLPVQFFHADYMDWDQYPEGIPDIVGYWAEYRLFGGVVLFDRGDLGTECKDVFIHPIRRYRIFRLSEAQIQHFVEFISSELPSRESQNTSQMLLPLPFRAERDTIRIDPYDAMSLNIYRNKYERKIPLSRPVHCVIPADDYPGYAEALADFARRRNNQEAQ